MFYLQKLLDNSTKDVILDKLKVLGSKAPSNIKKNAAITEYINFITNNAQEIWAKLDEVS